MRGMLWLSRVASPLPWRMCNQELRCSSSATTAHNSSLEVELCAAVDNPSFCSETDVDPPHNSSLEEEEEVDLGAAVGNPSSCVEADVDPALAQKLDLCESEGFDRLHTKQLLSPCHSFCKCSLSKLVSIIALLKRRHISGKHAALVLSRCPWILTYSPGILDKKIAFLEELGLQTPHLKKVLLNKGHSPILGLSLPNMQRHVDLLHNLGVDHVSIPKVIRSYPHFLCLNIEKNIKPTLQFLADKGMSKESLCKLLLIRPSILGYSFHHGLTEKLSVMQCIGCDISSKHGFRAFLHWSTLSSARIFSNFEFLKSQGLSHDDACKIAQQQPGVLNKRQESVQQSLDYLKNVLNRDIQEVVKFPAYLTYSLKTRIAPRITILNRDNFSLNYVLSLSNQLFDKRFVAKIARKGKPCPKM